MRKKEKDKDIKNISLSHEEVEEKVAERLQKDFAHYKQTLAFLGSNVPIETLCLPKAIETILKKQNYLRVCDLLCEDFTKIKGLGNVRLRYLTSRIDEFFSIGI